MFLTSKPSEWHFKWFLILKGDLFRAHFVVRRSCSWSFTVMFLSFSSSLVVWFLLRCFPFVVPFLPGFSLSSSSPYLSCYIELASIWTLSSCYWWSCDRNSVLWLMYCTGLHNPLPGTNEVSGNVLVANHHLKCHRTGVSVTVILTSPQFFPIFQGLVSSFVLFIVLSLELKFL